jgi:protein TonB
MMESKLIAPVAIPAKTALVDDPPPSPSAAESGTARASLGGDVMTMLSPSVFVPPPIQSVTAQAVPATKPVATEPPRYKVGGVVHMARLMHRVEPLYPAIARQARISGAVELRGVIGIDGRIRELQVVSGHPFLVKAALEAVRQWIYEPTLLNGDPVEVVAPITVTFHLI